MPPRPKRNLSRSVVAQAALSLLDAHPSKALTLREVARALGVKPSSLYNHVANLEDLHRAVAGLGWERLEERLEPVLGAGFSGAYTLRGCGYVVRAFLREHWALGVLMFGVCDVESVAVHRALCACWSDGALGGVVGEGADRAQRAFWACVYGFAALESSGFFADDVGGHESFERALAKVLRGGDGSDGVGGGAGGGFVA